MNIISSSTYDGVGDRDGGGESSCTINDQVSLDDDPKMTNGELPFTSDVSMKRISLREYFSGTCEVVKKYGNALKDNKISLPFVQESLGSKVNYF